MNTNNYKKDLKKVMILYPDLEVTSSMDYHDLINIHNLAELAFGENLNQDLVRKAFKSKDSFTKLSSANDYFYLLFLTANSESKISKFAYPNAPDTRDFGEPFDIKKWSGLVHKIYQDYERGEDLESVVSKHASTLDKKSEEDVKFKQWFRYLLDGENKKYDLSKFSSYRFSVNPGADYGVTAPGVQHLQGNMIQEGSSAAPVIPSSLNLSGVQPIIDRFNAPPAQQMQPVPSEATKESEQESAAKDAAREEDKKAYRKWKKSLDTAIRRIDKLLRSSDDYLESGVQKALAGLLHEFDQEVRDIKYHATASDLAMEYANIFKKLGFDSGYDEIIKFAQEAPPAPEAPVAPAAPEGEATPAPAPPAAEGTPPAAKEGEAEAEEDRGKTPLERALAPITEAKEGEYESLAGDVGLGDAIAKLEDIAGRLSDRRTIRLLAEFDIILDKIGIAPMFPELAEAQSKLIDAYSYALTRVTKMLGMLSSGKSIFEISDVKKKELISKTMKDLNRTMETAEGEGEGGEEEPKKSPESTQAGLEEAGLTEGAKATPEAAPKAPAAEATPAPAAEEAPKG